MTREPSRRASQCEEHNAILTALLDMERFVAWLKEDTDSDWRAHALADLRAIRASIDHHCRSAEGPDGLLPEIERTEGRSHSVSAARKSHCSLQEQAAALAEALDQDATERAPLRELGDQLVRALKRHLQLQADLIQAPDRDSGVGD